MNPQLTQPLSPFNDSLSHLRKSCDGVVDKSSARGATAGFAGAAAGRAAVPFGRWAVAEGGAAGARDGGTTGVEALPFAPTVDHAPTPGPDVDWALDTT